MADNGKNPEDAAAPLCMMLEQRTTLNVQDLSGHLPCNALVLALTAGLTKNRALKKLIGSGQRKIIQHDGMTDLNERLSTIQI